MPHDYEDFTPIRPRKVRLSHNDEAAVPVVPKKTVSVWILVLPALLLLAAFWIFFVLPIQVSKPTVLLSTPASQTPASVVPANSSKQNIAPLQQLELERAREKAKDTLARYVQLQIQLEDKMQVAKWGGKRYAHMRKLASRGDELFLQQKYDQAIAMYQKGIQALQQLVTQGEKNYRDALQRGQAALIAMSAPEAIAAFETAATIHPDASEVTAGLRRSQSLPQVIELLDQARANSEAGKLMLARAAYVKARAIDAKTPGIDKAIAKLDQRLMERNFKRHLSEGYAALSDRRFKAAIASFKQALLLKPGDEIVLDGLRQVKQNRKLAQISQLKKQAQQFSAEEKWAQALAVFNSALKLDPALKFARAGRSLARQRMDLDQHLQDAVTHPERLSSDTLYSNTQSLYAEASAISAPGPRLTRQIRRLQKILAVAAQPVDVTLLSDGKTEVTIQLVGPLGSFASKKVVLRPGRYVITGSRDGCRDVRKEINISEGMPPIAIQCEESI